MTIQYDTDLRLQMHISNCFNAKNNVSSAYRLLDEYLRYECGLTSMTWMTSSTASKSRSQSTSSKSSNPSKHDTQSNQHIRPIARRVRYLVRRNEKAVRERAPTNQAVG